MSVSASKRAQAAAGHHAMTTISAHMSRYPLTTAFVKVANTWTVEKNVAKHLSKEEQNMMVLVPIRFMVSRKQRASAVLVAGFSSSLIVSFVLLFSGNERG